MRVLRWVIPADDEWHEIAGTPLHVETRAEPYAEVWTLNEVIAEVRWVRLFGTGHEVPDGSVYLGTAVTPSGRLVWHVFERVAS